MRQSNIVIGINVEKRRMPLSAYMTSGYVLPSNRASFVNHEIQARLIITKDFNRDAFDFLYQSILRSVRHELEHAQQYEKELLNSREDADNPNVLESRPEETFRQRAQYIRNGLEQDAFIRAMMLSCKKTKYPIKEVVNDFIEKQLYVNEDREIYIKKIMGNEAVNIENDLRSIYEQKIESFYPNQRR